MQAWHTCAAQTPLGTPAPMLSPRLLHLQPHSPACSAHHGTQSIVSKCALPVLHGKAHPQRPSSGPPTPAGHWSSPRGNQKALPRLSPEDRPGQAAGPPPSSYVSGHCRLPLPQRGGRGRQKCRVQSLGLQLFTAIKPQQQRPRGHRSPGHGPPGLAPCNLPAVDIGSRPHAGA